MSRAGETARQATKGKTNGTDWFPVAQLRDEAAAARGRPFRSPGFVTGGRKRSHPLITQLKRTGNPGSPSTVGLDDATRCVDSVTTIVTITATTGVTVSKGDAVEVSSMEFVLNDCSIANDALQSIGTSASSM